MVQKSGDHQLRLVVNPIIFNGFLDIPGGYRRIFSINSSYYTCEQWKKSLRFRVFFRDEMLASYVEIIS